MGEHKTTFRDYDSELSTCSIPIPNATEATVDAQTPLMTALLVAVAGVSVGVAASETWIGAEDYFSDIPATNTDAQRETKWECFYHVTAAPAKRYKLEMPCANLELLAVDSAEYDKNSVEWPIFKAAFEAFVVSWEGYNVTLDKVVHKGANL